MSQPASTEEKPAQPRSYALDAFRGLAILGMLVVNNIALGEATPRTFFHAEWSGKVHFADLVFPWFLVAMGIACGLGSKPTSSARLARRVLALLLLGMLVDSAVRGEIYVGLGVLQLIGLAYGVAALAMRLPPWARVTIALAMLIVHTALIMKHGSVTEESNAIYALNPILEPLKLRGLLSVLPTGCLAILASFVGGMLRRESGPSFITAAGLAMMLFGLLIGEFVPMIKPIWTSSYVLYAGGLGILVLAAFVAVEKSRAFPVAAWPLLIFGGNAIVAYVGPILFKVLVLQRVTIDRNTLVNLLGDALEGSLGQIGGGLTYLGMYIGLWLLICAVLARYKLFLRV